MQIEAPYNNINCCDHTACYMISQVDLGMNFGAAWAQNSRQHFSESVGKNYEIRTVWFMRVSTLLGWHKFRDRLHTFPGSLCTVFEMAFWLLVEISCTWKLLICCTFHSKEIKITLSNRLSPSGFFLGSLPKIWCLKFFLCDSVNFCFLH